MMASAEGGMDIEEVAHNTPEKILKVFVDPLVGLTDARPTELAKGIGMPEAVEGAGRYALKGCTPATWKPTPRWPKSTR
jgi:succinyl-CoA synthetase beta subunit